MSFSPDTKLIGGRKSTLVKLTTPSVLSTGYTAVSPPSLATSCCCLSSQPYTHPMPSLPPGFPVCVPAPCSFTCGRASVPAPLSPFSSPFSLRHQGPSPVNMFLLDHQLLRMGNTAEQMGRCSALSRILRSSNSFLRGVLPGIPEAVCCVPGTLKELHFFRTNSSSSSQHIGAPGFSLFSAALTPQPRPCTAGHRQPPRN